MDEKRRSLAARFRCVAARVVTFRGIGGAEGDGGNDRAAGRHSRSADAVERDAPVPEPTTDEGTTDRRTVLKRVGAAGFVAGLAGCPYTGSGTPPIPSTPSRAATTTATDTPTETVTPPPTGTPIGRDQRDAIAAQIEEVDRNPDDADEIRRAAGNRRGHREMTRRLTDAGYSEVRKTDVASYSLADGDARDMLSTVREDGNGNVVALATPTDSGAATLAVALDDTAHDSVQSGVAVYRPDAAAVQARGTLADRLSNVVRPVTLGFDSPNGSYGDDAAVGAARSFEVCPTLDYPSDHPFCGQLLWNRRYEDHRRDDSTICCVYDLFLSDRWHETEFDNTDDERIAFFWEEPSQDPGACSRWKTNSVEQFSSGRGNPPTIRTNAPYVDVRWGYVTLDKLEEWAIEAGAEDGDAAGPYLETASGDDVPDGARSQLSNQVRFFDDELMTTGQWLASSFCCRWRCLSLSCVAQSAAEVGLGVGVCATCFLTEGLATRACAGCVTAAAGFVTDDFDCCNEEGKSMEACVPPPCHEVSYC